jgi:cytochrome c oxidase subunit IV
MSEIVVPRKTYVKVWAALLMLLGLTVAVAYLHLGWANPAAALGIAGIKATLIILYFMHVRYSPRLVWVFVGAGFFWLCIMFALTFGDYLTRPYLPHPTIWQR